METDKCPAQWEVDVNQGRFWEPLLNSKGCSELAWDCLLHGAVTGNIFPSSQLPGVFHGLRDDPFFKHFQLPSPSPMLLWHPESWICYSQSLPLLKVGLPLILSGQTKNTFNSEKSRERFMQYSLIERRKEEFIFLGPDTRFRFK